MALNNVIIPPVRQVHPTLVVHRVRSAQPGANIFTTKFNYTFCDVADEKFYKKYKFSRAKWYYCSYKPGNSGSCTEWCREQFGTMSTGGDAWMRWKPQYGDYKFRFLNEDDAIMFRLRWGGESIK